MRVVPQSALDGAFYDGLALMSALEKPVRSEWMSSLSGVPLGKKPALKQQSEESVRNAILQRVR